MDAAPEKVQQAEQKEDATTATATATTTSPGEHDSVPWYLRTNEDVTQLNPALTEPIPDTPENSPECLATITEFMIRELGFTDVTFIDLRNRSPVTIWGSDAILVLASGNTDRHIGRGTNSLMTFIKKTYNVIPKQEGIQTSGFLKVHQRRLKKKAKKMANSDETFDYAMEASRFANNWVVLDTKMDGITIHMFTQEKREELDLEYVWAEDKKALRESRKQLEAETETEDRGEYGSESRYSPFSNFGQVRNYHSTRAFSSLPGLGSIQNTISSPSPSFDFGSTNKSVLDQLRVLSFAGDYKKAMSIPRPNYTEAEDAKHTHLLLKAHINHLSNIKNSPEASSLTAKSSVITSFISAFPYYPTQIDWRLRLIFIQHAHEANPTAFPLATLEENLIVQQASGFPVDTWDVELVVNTIVNSKQYADKRMLKASDLKSNLIFSIVKNCLRPQGTHLANNNTFYMMLYRLWIGEPELVPADAFSDPTPKRDETTGDLLIDRKKVMNSKSLSIYQYMLQSGQSITKPFLILSLTAFANDNIWGKFWSLWARISKDKSVDSELFNNMASLVVKSGNQVAITHLVDQILPKELMANKDLLTSELISILKTALECLDPSGSGYVYLRKQIQDFA